MGPAARRVGPGNRPASPGASRSELSGLEARQQLDWSAWRLGERKPSADVNGKACLSWFVVLGRTGCAVLAGAPGTEQCLPVHAFRPGSPAVNAGSNPENLEFDQRGAGFPRVNDGQADIGAYKSSDAVFADRFQS